MDALSDAMDAYARAEILNPLSTNAAAQLKVTAV